MKDFVHQDWGAGSLRIGPFGEGLMHEVDEVKRVHGAEAGENLVDQLDLRWRKLIDGRFVGKAQIVAFLDEVGSPRARIVGFVGSFYQIEGRLMTGP